MIHCTVQHGALTSRPEPSPGITALEVERWGPCQEDGHRRGPPREAYSALSRLSQRSSVRDQQDIHSAVATALQPRRLAYRSHRHHLSTSSIARTTSSTIAWLRRQAHSCHDVPQLQPSMSSLVTTPRDSTIVPLP